MFDVTGLDAYGKRMHMGADQLVWSDTYRDKNLQLRFRRDGNRLHVRGIDAWDGTPVVDIKGYAPRDDIRADAKVPKWLDRLWKTHDEERAARG